MALTTAVDLKAVAKVLEGYTIVRKNPLMICIADDSYVTVASFGAVVCWNYTPTEDPPVTRRILDAGIAAGDGVYSIDDRARDVLAVDASAKADEALFDVIRLADASPDRVYIVSLALAQSLALERVELDVERILRGLVTILEDLRDDGKIRVRNTELLKTIGFSMGVQAEVMSGLSLLDRPAETWESETLHKLFDRMYDYFDIAQRRAALERKVDFIENSVAVIMDVVNSRKSHRLETIVILLIAWEVLQPLLFKLGIWPYTPAVAGS
jgi:uncharacterized Rmd1/YagE family protein